MSGLASLAAHAGITMVEKVLTGRLGDEGGQLASDLVAHIARRAGVLPADLDPLVEQEPGRVIEAMRDVEPVVPELLAHEVEMFRARLAAEETEPYWMRAWRPGMMYLIGFLWLWNIVILHVANAIWKIALPPAPWDVLMTLTGTYAALYMGGHTVLRAIGKAGGK
jgi:hypothetical protein